MFRIPPLKGGALTALMHQLGGGWNLVEDHHLEKEFIFRNFREALAFTNRVGEIAEQEKHHPDLFLSYGRVKIQLWTHKIDGLSENDFIFAAKCNRLIYTEMS